MGAARYSETAEQTYFSTRCRNQKGMSNSRHYEQDKQCTYNVTLMRVRVTIVEVEKQ